MEEKVHTNFSGRKRVRLSVLALIVLSFVLFTFLYMLVVIHGHEPADIQMHIILAALREQDLWDDLPHGAFHDSVMFLTSVFERVKVDRLLQDTFHVSTEAMRAKFEELQQKYLPVDLRVLSLPRYRSFSLLNAHAAAVVIVAFFLSLSLYADLKILEHLVPRSLNLPVLMGAAVALQIVSALAIPSFNEHFFVGQGSPNPWHSPTFIMLKPLASLAFVLTAAALVRGRMAIVIAAGCVLLASMYVKPSFALVLIPALFCYVVARHRLKRDAYIRVGLITLPAVLYLAYQFLGTFMTSTSSGEQSWPYPRSVHVGFLTVWRIFSPSVPVSIALALAFPVSLLAVSLQKHIRWGAHLILAWLMTIVGLIQYAVLAEGGAYLTGANFIWGYSVALHVLFVVSVASLIGFASDAEGNRAVALRVVPWLFFGAHLVSGVYLAHRYFSGHGI